MTQRKTKAVVFSEKELAYLIDALVLAKTLNVDVRKAWSNTDKRTSTMLFKLRRALRYVGRT